VNSASTPPFRAEHVGSLLRPANLLQARTEAEGDQYRQVSGPLKFEQLKQLEDAAIVEVVKLQESAGLQGITDGEFRRRSWFQDFLLSLSGTGIHWIDAGKTISAALPFQNDTTVEKLPGHIVRVTGKIRRTKGIFTDAFAFLKTQTNRTPKISIPSPTMLHFWGGRDAIDRAVYPDLAEFWSDAVAAWTAEIKDLAALGCTYIQIDDVTFPLVCDPHAQDALKARGEDPHQLIETYASVLNRIVAGTPNGVTLGMHMCRGNNRGKWMGSGGYEYVSEVVLRNVDIPNYFMEYDTDRAGDFAPLRHVPKGKHVILGLISTKTPVLESKDVVKRRIDEAAKVLPLDQLCLSPQCGFASNFMGNPVTVDDEKKKLSLVVEVAREVWG
jgi:5-methyltetrahydropteroyltriglutamate--homocysteine methyltransferase